MMRDGAERFFHRIAVICAVFRVQIRFDHIAMLDQFLIDKGCRRCGLIDKSDRLGQILLDLRIFRFHVGAHLGINRQIFALPLQFLLSVHKAAEAFTGLRDVSLCLRDLVQQLFRMF